MKQIGCWHEINPNIRNNIKKNCNSNLKPRFEFKVNHYQLLLLHTCINGWSYISIYVAKWLTANKIITEIKLVSIHFNSLR